MSQDRPSTVLAQLAARYREAAGEAFVNGDDPKATLLRDTARKCEEFGQALPELPRPTVTTRGG